jgi:hypothetical protein
MPLNNRGGGCVVPARPTKATLRPDLRGADATSSTLVFHSPQPSQRPTHLVVTQPQLWQTNLGGCLAIEARQKNGSSAFLKKRSKKLLSVLTSAFPDRLGPASRKFFGAFFQKRTA